MAFFLTGLLIVWIYPDLNRFSGSIAALGATVNRKHKTEKVARQLSSKGIQARHLNGGMTQQQRERVTADFRRKAFNVLVATDVAARGLHIDNITHVCNDDIPRDVESYTHRVGRTARAGKQSKAISLVEHGEDKRFFKDSYGVPQYYPDENS